MTSNDRGTSGQRSDGEAPPEAPEPGDIPNEREAAAEFPHGDDRPLREQRDVKDETGDDIRQYTGEPVETEHGTVIPQQMAVGADEVVGGGEFPDEPPRGDEPADGKHRGTTDEHAPR